MKKAQDQERREKNKTVEINAEVEAATNLLQREAFDLEQKAAAIKRESVLLQD
jgi:hypothetical protein